MGLNNHVKGIINAVAKNDMDGARAHAKCILAEDSSKTNAEYRARMNKLLNQKGINMLQLPPNISKNALLEDVSITFHEDRYYLTGQMQSLYHRIMRKRAVCFEMERLGISFKNTTLLYGPPGTGKTEFGRYMAYKMGLPFLYLNFSQCIDSYMGGTAKNISGVFDFARDNECLLMLDEIDTVASNRSGSDNSGVDGERNRITISIMQEFDRLQSRTVVIAATNRIDLLDEALLNRFTIKEEVSLPSANELLHVAECFYHSIQREIPHDFNIYKSQTQRELANRMVERLAEDLATELEASGMLEEEEKPHLPIEVSEEVYQNIRSRTQQYVVLRGLNDVYVGAILDITKRSYNSSTKEYNRALVRTVKTLEPAGYSGDYYVIGF